MRCMHAADTTAAPCWCCRRSLEYDASGKSTFRGVVAGIVIMAVSLVLLSLV